MATPRLGLVVEDKPTELSYNVILLIETCILSLLSLSLSLSPSLPRSTHTCSHRSSTSRPPFPTWYSSASSSEQSLLKELVKDFAFFSYPLVAENGSVYNVNIQTTIY